jgi:hypothetical protein
MARKTNKAILTEGEMRRFMKLAKISPLQEMDEAYGMPGARDEEEDEPGMRDDMMEQEEEEEVEAAEMEAPMDDEPAMDEPEMDMDMGMDAEEGGEKMVDVEQFLSILDSALTDAVEEVTGQEVEVSADMEMDGGLEAPEEGGEDLDMEMPPMADDEEEEMDMDMMAERIARRVKARMMQESRKQKALDQRVDELTDKIFARLMKESR